MRGKLVVGNWKSNGSLAANQTLLQSLLQQPQAVIGAAQAVVGAAQAAAGVGCGIGRSVGICVPYVYLAQTQHVLAGSNIAWGAQDVSAYGAGAYTGAVTAQMLAEFGCRYALVGHSERRALFGETDAVVATKFVAARNAGLTPILCVGETLQEREAGITEQVVGRQFAAVVAQAGIAALANAVVAYEPVWAIGTGKTATPEQAQAVHAFIRAQAARHDASIANDLPLLYGGSVKASNAAELFAQADIDGGLIGGASLVAEEFLAICAAMQ